MRGLLLGTVSFLWLQEALASRALDRMFESLGSDITLSTPGAFQDQAAGHYTGGGFYLRNRRETFQPLQISLPHFGGRCGAMNAYFGAFSFMKGEHLVRLLRNMGTQAASYGFQLALKTMAPQVENTFSQLRDIALRANALALEDCRMVEQVYASALPKGTAFQEAVCQDVKRQGSGEDWFGAKEKCQKNEAVQHAIAEKRTVDKDLMTGEYNLVWHALQKMEGMAQNQELAEFIMSICGTLLSRKEEEQYRIHTIQGKGDTKDFLSAHLKGGDTHVLKCDTKDKCLKPSWTPKTISGEEGDAGMRLKVRRKMLEIKTKYLEKGTFTPEDLMFLNDSVNLPVYRYIQVSAAVGAEFLLSDALEYSALSILLTQFEKLTGRVLEALDQLQAVQLEDAQIERFKKTLQQTRSRLQILTLNADQGALYRLNTMMKAYEDQLSVERGVR